MLQCHERVGREEARPRSEEHDIESRCSAARTRQEGRSSSTTMKLTSYDDGGNIVMQELRSLGHGTVARLLDNVLSDYLWAKAILLTTTTVATAGLTIQVPIAAFVDSITGHAPRLFDYIGAVSIILGFVGINIPSSEKALIEHDAEEIVATNHDQDTPALTRVV